MLDFCVGLDTEFSEIVEGSHLYYPKTKFEQVCSLDTNITAYDPIIELCGHRWWSVFFLSITRRYAVILR